MWYLFKHRDSFTFTLPLHRKLLGRFNVDSYNASMSALRPTQPPGQRILGALSLGVKRPDREADHASPSSAEVKNAWSYISTPPIRFHGVVLS